MVHLSDYEIGWLRHRQPQMQYNNETGIWEGLFCFSLQYQNKEVITDEYYIKVDFKSNGDLPLVYDEERKRLIGERTNKTFKIGDIVKIRVIEANKALRKISFELFESKEKENVEDIFVEE